MFIATIFNTQERLAISSSINNFSTEHVVQNATKLKEIRVFVVFFFIIVLATSFWYIVSLPADVADCFWMHTQELQITWLLIKVVYKFRKSQIAYFNNNLILICKVAIIILKFLNLNKDILWFNITVQIAAAMHIS